MEIDRKECHPAMDYDQAEDTYNLFYKLTVWSIVGVCAVLILMAIFLL